MTLDLFNNASIIGSMVHRTIQLNSVLAPLQSHYNVRVLHSVILPKRSKNFIAAYINVQLPNESNCFLIEDNLRPSASLYAVGQAPENGQCPIIMNKHIAKAHHISHSENQKSDTGSFNPYVQPEADWKSKIPKFPLSHPGCHDIANEVDLTRICHPSRKTFSITS